MSRWLDYIYAELNKKVLSLCQCKLKLQFMYIFDILFQVWTSGCTSYHRNEKGVVHTIWPNNVVEYWWRLLWCDMADFRLRK